MHDLITHWDLRKETFCVGKLLQIREIHCPVCAGKDSRHGSRRYIDEVAFSRVPKSTRNPDKKSTRVCECKYCKTHLPVTKGTIFYNSKLPLNIIWRLLRDYAQVNRNFAWGRKSGRVMNVIKITERLTELLGLEDAPNRNRDTARRWLNQFRELSQEKIKFNSKGELHRWDDIIFSIARDEGGIEMSYAKVNSHKLKQWEQFQNNTLEITPGLDLYRAKKWQIKEYKKILKNKCPASWDAVKGILKKIDEFQNTPAGITHWDNTMWSETVYFFNNRNFTVDEFLYDLVEKGCHESDDEE